MRQAVIVETQNALAKEIRQRIQANQGEHDMVSSLLMAAIAGFEVASQLATFNEALAKLGGEPASRRAGEAPETSYKRKQAPPAPPVSPEAPVETLDAAAPPQEPVQTASPLPRGVRKIPAIPAPAPGRVVRRIVREPEKPLEAVVLPPKPKPDRRAAQAASLVQPPVDNYPAEFGREAAEGEEMDRLEDELRRDLGLR